MMSIVPKVLYESPRTRRRHQAIARCDDPHLVAEFENEVGCGYDVDVAAADAGYRRSVASPKVKVPDAPAGNLLVREDEPADVNSGRDEDADRSACRRRQRLSGSGPTKVTTSPGAT